MVEPYFEYIDENLNWIIQNPNSVLYLKPYYVGKKQALFAMIKEEKGVYRNLQITKEQSKLTFPFEPIYWFYKGPGHWYLKENRDIVIDNYMALNTTNLEGFKTKKLGGAKIFNVGIFATFNDGTAAFVNRKGEKEFQKKGGIQFYIELLKKYKEFDPQHEEYKILDYYIQHDCNDDNRIIIPELQEKTEEHPKTLKLEPTKKDNSRI